MKSLADTLLFFLAIAAIAAGFLYLSSVNSKIKHIEKTSLHTQLLVEELLHRTPQTQPIEPSVTTPSCSYLSIPTIR